MLISNDSIIFCPYFPVSLAFLVFFFLGGGGGGALMNSSLFQFHYNLREVEDSDYYSLVLLVVHWMVALFRLLIQRKDILCISFVVTLASILYK